MDAARASVVRLERRGNACRCWVRVYNHRGAGAALWPRPVLPPNQLEIVVMTSARVRALAVSGLVCGAAGLVQASGIGPDITVLYIGEGDFSRYEKYGPVNDIVAFAFATTSCNRGDVVAQWFTTGLNANRHPVIAQQAYRYDNGVMEQIGLAWLKHGFCAVNEPGCGTCQPTDCDTLGIGCADTYWALLNANGLAPRSPVNASNENRHGLRRPIDQISPRAPG